MCSNCSVASSKTCGYVRKMLIPMEGLRGQLTQNLCVCPQTGFGYFSREHKKDMESIKHNLQQQMLGPQAKIQTKGTEKPDDPKIIERHEVTHLPFAPWCDSCLKTKSREDKTIQNTDAAEEDSGVPHIQMDWMYLGRNCPALILLDTTTRYGAIFPSKEQGCLESSCRVLCAVLIGTQLFE